MNCNNVVMEKEVNELSNIDLSTNMQQKALSTKFSQEFDRYY